MSILVTGGKGQVGWELARLLRENGVPFAAPGHDELDITDDTSVRRTILRMSELDAVIHCAAYTAVDRAETEPEKAFQVNARGTRIVAQACAERNVAMVYLSTDYVFDGTKSAPYEVDDPPSPINVYGKSKLAGEQAAREILPDKHYIVRTSWVFGVHGNNFPKAILRAAAAGQPLRVVDDQVGSPTYAPDLAEAILMLLGIDLQHPEGVQRISTDPDTGSHDALGCLQPAPYGTYHVTNSGSCSWYEFARMITDLAHYAIAVIATKSESPSARAKRPTYSVLSNRSVRSVDLTVRPWVDAIAAYLVNHTAPSLGVGPQVSSEPGAR